MPEKWSWVDAYNDPEWLEKLLEWYKHVFYMSTQSFEFKVLQILDQVYSTSQPEYISQLRDQVSYNIQNLVAGQVQGDVDVLTDIVKEVHSDIAYPHMDVDFGDLHWDQIVEVCRTWVTNEITHYSARLASAFSQNDTYSIIYASSIIESLLIGLESVEKNRQ